MIDFSKFYNDLELVAALLYNNFLKEEDIKEIASALIGLDQNDILIDISVSTNSNVTELFGNYLKSKQINITNPKKFLTKKLFQYVLANKIDIKSSMEFINFKISEEDRVKEYIGDDIGVEQILGNFWIIEDGDVQDIEEIQQLTKTINEDMSKYIEEN